MSIKNKIAFFALFTVLLFTQAHSQAQGLSQATNPKASIEKIATAMQLINYFYVEKVDQDKLADDAIINMLKELDPHSVYISKKEVDETNEPLVGNFEGVGIQFQLFHDTIMVISPVPGGPSEKLGILAGDKIIRINGADAFGSKVTNSYVLAHLRGPKGTKVTVSILRKGHKGLLEYTITRDKIPLNSIDATLMLTPDIGIIKLSRFARTSMDEFRESLAKLKAAGMKSLILDLRGNSGGYLDVAVDLADQFLSADKLIVFTEGLHSPKQEFRATFQGGFETGKLVVLIDEGSASASEIVSGAVQDWDRGLIIGRRSFGKGLVQRPYMLPDSSMIRLTTARYFTPSGRCIQKSYKDGAEDYFEDVYKRYKHGEFIHADSIHFPDSLRFYTGNKRTVYGGGGIMPDIFIPLDTTYNSKYYTDLWRKGLLNEFSTQFIEDNRKSLVQQYPKVKTFVDNFIFDDKLLNQFVEFAEKKGIPRDKKGLELSGKEIRYVIKGLIARSLFNVDAYFEVISGIDEELQKAVELINDDSSFKKLAGTK
ncbi:MAG TPA: S41 family peptidase [Bacteroidales bacterium]